WSPRPGCTATCASARPRGRRCTCSGPRGRSRRSPVATTCSPRTSRRPRSRCWPTGCCSPARPSWPAAPRPRSSRTSSAAPPSPRGGAEEERQVPRGRLLTTRGQAFLLLGVVTTLGGVLLGYPDITRVGAVLVLMPLRSEEHTSELQSREKLVCRLLLEKKKKFDDLVISGLGT